MYRIGLAIAALCASIGNSEANGQVVQLPTFNFFGISTTVSVPDSGAGFVGGNSISSMGRFERGVPLFGHAPVAGRLLGNRAIAGRTQTSGVSVSATIHDFEAMDESLLGEALADIRRPVPLSERRVGVRPRERIRESGNRTVPRAIVDAAGRTSVAELRGQQARQGASKSDAARLEYERALALMAEGKTGVARVYLQKARKHADPSLRADIDAAHRGLRVSGTMADAGPKPALER